MRKKLLLWSMAVFMAMLLLTLAGCIPGDGANSPHKPAGFFWGIWHGWVAPVSLIISLFGHNIRVYEVFNTGWWYDFAFYMAIVGGFGGLSLFRRNKEKR